MDSYNNHRTGHQNLHTHTNYCDGRLPPEEMVKAAIQNGCDSLGFSEHSYVPHDPRFSTPPEVEAEYVREINGLKVKYEGIIEIFLGIEFDYFTAIPLEGLDFRIGSAHYVQAGGTLYSVDASPQDQKSLVDEHFGGSFFAMAEVYFETIAGIMGKTDADIIGHFDLAAKYNMGGSLFDEKHPRYVGAALGAMDEILKGCAIFEINTKMMYQYNKQEPYPSVFLLKELQKRGGEVVLSSDSHDAGSMCYKFDDMRELLKTIGFRYLKRLTKDGFIDVKL